MGIKLQVIPKILIYVSIVISSVSVLQAQELKPCNINGKFGFRDKTGNIVIPAKYDRALDFCEDLARVMQKGKWGYIDKTGLMVIPVQFDLAYSFSNGIAKVRKNGENGFINKNGKFYLYESQAVEAVKLSEASWTDYLAYNLGTKIDFFKSRGIVEKKESAIKAEVEKEIAIWQTKGEFETTQQWKERVTDQTRNAKANEIATKLVADYNENLEVANAVYDRRYRQLVSDFSKILERKFASQKIELKPYDADNQTFLIVTQEYGDILLPVPLTEAPIFKSKWASIRNNIGSEFAFVGDGFALKSVSFGDYVYDSNTQATYSQVDADMNFRPIDISGINYEFADISEKTPTITVAKSVVTPRKVTPEKTVVKLGNMADVDINIPESGKIQDGTFALIIANENYRRLSSVPFALNDGEIIRKYFNLTLGIPERNIMIATDASGNDIKYYIDHISDICRTLGNDASLLVYYAGHGVPDNTTKNAYLMPIDGYAERTDATGISLDDLYKRLQDLPTKQTIVFLDACFGGTDRYDNMLSEARGVRIKPRSNVVHADNFVVFTASQGDQTAHPYNEMNHGLFTYFILKKMSESKGDVTLGELVDYVTNQVKRKSVLDGKLQDPTITFSSTNTNWKSWRF